MRHLLMVASLLLPGCAMFDGPDITPVRDTVSIQFTLTEDIPAGRDGQATSFGDFCIIQLRPSVYPRCVTHEVAHCFGWVHDGRPNGDYCDY
ncbi:MAG: hypothetical protein ABFE08_07100 [Armatimonadia bacterium]